MSNDFEKYNKKTLAGVAKERRGFCHTGFACRNESEHPLYFERRHQP